MLEWRDAEGMSATCKVADVTRACARRLACFALDPPDDLRSEAGRLAERHGSGSGRVQPAGPCVRPAVFHALQAALPKEWRPALRATFEWYTCRGAHFHNDAHYGGVLFGAWCLAGPAMELVFPRTGWRVASALGTAAVFDPFEPHGVLLPGHAIYAAARYPDVAPSVFLAFEIELTAPVRTAFGIGEPPAVGPVLSSDQAVNAETGAVA